jgi:ferritin-like metal-binding protein YciE
MKPESLKEILIDNLRELFDLLIQNYEILPDVIQSGTDSELRIFCKELLGETKMQILALKDIFVVMEKNTRGNRSAAVERLFMEVEAFIDSNYDPEILDTGLISYLRKVETYKITLAEICKGYADLLHLFEVSTLLGSVLEYSHNAKYTLTAFAENKIDLEASE